MAWRQDATRSIRRGELRATEPITIREAADAWLKGARAGLITTRSGDPYKPSAVRSYETALRLRVLPALGNRKVGDVTRTELQDLIEALRAEGLSASTVGVTILPLRAIFRRELSRGHLTVNPTTGLDLPAVRGGRDRIADPIEAAALLTALPSEDRALWACAFYGGLRRGELMALREENLDLPGGLIHVIHGWDAQAGEQSTKGRNRRVVPIPQALRAPLSAHLLVTGRRGRDLVFGVSPTSPFRPETVTARADAAWAAAGLKRITLHGCRHTFASLAIQAGVNIGTVSAALGHASVTITWDRYHHLMPGAMDQAAELLDTYLDSASAKAPSISGGLQRRGQ